MMKSTSQSSDTPLSNQRQETFAQNVASGKTAQQAYMDAYECTTQGIARRNSSRLIKTNALVRARIEWLQAENARASALSRAEKRQLLAQIARSGMEDSDRIRAIQEDNRMTGDAEDKVSFKGVFNLKW